MALRTTLEFGGASGADGGGGGGAFYEAVDLRNLLRRKQLNETENVSELGGDNGSGA